MNKQAKNTIVMLVVLALLIGAYFGIKAYNAAHEEEAETVTSTSTTLYSTAISDIVSFSYTYNGTLYSYEKQEDAWVCLNDTSLILDTDLVESALNALVTVPYHEEIENVSDMSVYGLSDDSDYFTLKWATETESHEIHIGDYNSITSYTYFSSVENPTSVYLTTKTNLKNNFQMYPDELIYVEEEEEDTESTDDASDTESTDDVTDTESGSAE